MLGVSSGAEGIIYLFIIGFIFLALRQLFNWIFRPELYEKEGREGRKETYKREYTKGRPAYNHKYLDCEKYCQDKEAEYQYQKSLK